MTPVLQYYPDLFILQHGSNYDDDVLPFNVIDFRFASR